MLCPDFSVESITTVQPYGDYELKFKKIGANCKNENYLHGGRVKGAGMDETLQRKYIKRRVPRRTPWDGIYYVEREGWLETTGHSVLWKPCSQVELSRKTMLPGTEC